MKRGLFLFILVLGSQLVASVTQSIVPELTCFSLESSKLGAPQKERIESLTAVDPLRVMTFNMLYSYWDEYEEPDNRWPLRGPRVIEYIQFAQPDVLGSQELLPEQLTQLASALGETYAYYGEVQECETLAIFYRKDRLELLEGRTYWYSETPEVKSCGPSDTENTFSVALFRDRQTGKECRVVNTHLSFSSCEQRVYEAKILAHFLENLPQASGVIVTGDFNTFPFRPDQCLPFYDGPVIERLIKGEHFEDTQEIAVYGHRGPISSTNYCATTKRSFHAMGTPGVILDHIYTNDQVIALVHGIDAARVDGHFPSDHFPVIADVALR